MLIARNIRKGRWDREAPDGVSGPCADALTKDLATQSDKMSWWIADESTERIATAIASTRESISNVDLAIVEIDDIKRLNIAWEFTKGKTPYPAANDQHCDLFNLSAYSVACLAEHVHSVRDHITRFREDKILSLLKAAIESSELDVSKVGAKLVCSLAKKVCGSEHAEGGAKHAILVELRRRLDDGTIDDDLLGVLDNRTIAALESVESSRID